MAVERIERRKVSVQAEEGGIVHMHLPQKDVPMRWESAIELSRKLHAEGMKARQAEMLKKRKAG